LKLKSKNNINKRSVIAKSPITVKGPKRKNKQKKREDYDPVDLEEVYKNPDDWMIFDNTNLKET